MNIKEENKENTQTKRSKRITMKKLKKNVKGITLIALVVTIIVLLILAGVALNLTIGQNGIFSRAQDAANTWRNAETNEQVAMNDLSSWMDEAIGNNNDNEDDNNKSLADITGNETTNTVTQDKYGNPITIPAGFKVVNPDDDVTKGIVIEDVSAPGKTSDTKGSQFVWIPVGDVITDEEGSTTTITLGRYTFGSDGTPSPYSGSYTEDTKDSHNSSYGNAIAKDIEDFISKATTSGGYYIGRYEAGDATATDSARTGTDNASNPDNPITCKSGVYPYNHINQEDASNLARGMYTSSNFDSDLINSYAWDTAIVFIQTFSGDTNYSKQIGSNTSLSLQKCGESILKRVGSGDEAQDVRCNIYDMAGNTYEWTTETYSGTYFPCVNRGGYCTVQNFSTSDRRYSGTTDSYSSVSFRPTLYL